VQNLKTNSQQLAVLGGTPAFTDKVHVGQPNIGSRERLLNRLNDMLDRRWLTNNGFYVKEFEHQVAEMIGVKHCIAICNATVALEIAIRALGLNGEVIVPSFTFIATAHALQWQEITPVFVDIDPLTHNLDPQQIERLITPLTTGIIGVHVWGRPCDTNALADIARYHNLKLLFDAAHAFGVSHQGKMIGNFGDAEVFSFHATKFINSFEGGAILTNDDHLAHKIRLMKNFGFLGYDNVVHVGTNGKMSEISAAMGLTNLESIEDFINYYRINYLTYQENFNQMPGISLISYDTKEQCNYQYVVVEVDENKCGLHRDHILQVLHAENVLARRYFWPGCHRMEPYHSFSPNAHSLPMTEMVAEKVLVLPTGTGISTNGIEIICNIIQTSIANSDEVRKSLTENK
jgi:dTDP-4-amino-4,6-dideoxygalactose transaminase